MWTLWPLNSIVKAGSLHTVGIITHLCSLTLPILAAVIDILITDVGFIFSLFDVKIRNTLKTIEIATLSKGTGVVSEDIYRDVNCHYILKIINVVQIICYLFNVPVNNISFFTEK